MSQGIRLQRIAAGHPTVTSTNVTQITEAATPCTQPTPSHQLQAAYCLDMPYRRAAESIRKQISGCWSKVEELWKAIKRDFITKAFVEMRACSVESWSKLKHWFSVIKQRFTLSVWLTIMISLVVGGVGLRYTDKATNLALWTATKDFYEYCQSQNVSASSRDSDCEKALQNPIRQPPYITLGSAKRLKWRDNILRNDGQIYYASGSVKMPIEDHSFVVRLLHLYPYIALICCCLACVRKRGRIRRLLNSCPRLQLVASISRNHPNARRPRVNSASDEIVGIHGISTAVPNPSNSGLRNRTTKSNSTIWKAAEEGDVEEIERHIESGVDVNAYSPSHGTPLSVAAYNGNADVVTSLLSRCAEVNGRYNGYRETALHSAAERGHETVVLSLLEHGADVNAQVSGMSAVYIASLKGHWTIVRILVSFGADEKVFLNNTRDVFERSIKSSVYGIAVTLERKVLDESPSFCDDLESQQNMCSSMEDFTKCLCDGLYYVAKDQSVSSISPSRSYFSDIESSVSFLDCVYEICPTVIRSRLTVLQSRLDTAFDDFVEASCRQYLLSLFDYLTFPEPNCPPPNPKSLKNSRLLRPRGITKPHLRSRRLRQKFQNRSRIRETGLHLHC